MSIPITPRVQQELKGRNANTAHPSKPHPAQPNSVTSAPVPIVTEIPQRLRCLEPTDPVKVANVDPVFDTVDAAAILGVKPDRLTKWRQRDKGPDYLQYDEYGPVRYELSALNAFKAYHRIRPSRQRNRGRR
jgi:hypothetical protein